MTSEADKALIEKLENNLKHTMNYSDKIVSIAESSVAMTETALDKNFLASATRILETMVSEIKIIQEAQHNAV